MARRPRIYRAGRRRVPYVTAFVRLLVCFAVISIPTLLLAVAIGKTTFKPNGQFVGELTTDQDPIIVNLPADVTISEVLVARGQTVRAGETLATFDKSALAAARTRLENETAALILERRCLLDPLLFGELGKSFLDSADELDQLLAIALESCQLSLAAYSDMHLEIYEDRASIAQSRAEILRQQQNLLSQIDVSEDVSQRPEVLFAALQLQLQINATDMQDNDARIQMQVVTELRHKTRLARLHELSRQVAQNNALLERIDAALQQPRVIAPIAGKVQRVRAIQRGTILPESVELLQITPTDHAEFVVRFPLPHDELDAVRVGDSLVVRPLGISLETPLVLSGHVTAFQADRGSTIEQSVFVSVTLDAQSTARLRDPNTRLAMHGTGTASIVEVTQNKRQMAHEIETVILRNCGVLLQSQCALRTPETEPMKGIQG